MKQLDVLKKLLSMPKGEVLYMVQNLRSNKVEVVTTHKACALGCYADLSARDKERGYTGMGYWLHEFKRAS